MAESRPCVEWNGSRFSPSRQVQPVAHRSNRGHVDSCTWSSVRRSTSPVRRRSTMGAWWFSVTATLPRRAPARPATTSAWPQPGSAAGRSDRGRWLSATAGRLVPCWRPRHDCCACSHCCRPTGTGPAPSSPSGSASPPDRPARRRQAARARLPGQREPGHRGRLPARCRGRTAAAAPRRRGGRRRRGRAAHGGRPRRGGHRGDLRTRTGQARAGTAEPAAPHG